MADALDRRLDGPASPLRPILVLSFSDLANDPRVSRQVALLAGRMPVTAAGFTRPLVEGADYVHLPRLRRSVAHRALAVAWLKLGRFEQFYWSSPTIRHAYEKLKERGFSLILANDLNALPLACGLKPPGGVIFDAHEYSPRELEDRLSWRFLYQGYNDYVCRRYLPATAGMLTVCQSIADEYRNNYGVSPEVLFSAPPYQNLEPRALAPGTIRMIHHGGGIPSRKIELMIDTMRHLDDRFRLDLMLVPGDVGYIRRLEVLVARDSRVRILAPVPMPDLPRHLNQYDIGLFLLPPTNFNYRYALPNKLFEFIQARLAVAIGPSPEMARLVRQYDCGIVSDEFSPRSLARQLDALDGERIGYFKQRSHLAARELCFEKNSGILLDMIESLAGKI